MDRIHFSQFFAVDFEFGFIYWSLVTLVTVRAMKGKLVICCHK
jgi:hypothetical protein